MTAFKEPFRAPSASPSEDRRAAELRILLTLAEVDPAASGATLILPDGSVTHLDVGQLHQGERI
jgi:hypothetical protein